MSSIMILLFYQHGFFWEYECVKINSSAYKCNVAINIYF